MRKKSFLSIMLAFLASSMWLCAQTTESSTTRIMLSSSTARTFTTSPVTDSEIDVIVRCGMQAPSAMNRQPWKFTVVKDNALISQIIPNTNQGNVLIVVSGLEASQPGMVPDFDCALATQNMYIAAQSLGLGSHIYMGPVSNINTTLKEALAIPEEYRAIAVLRIGNIDQGVDAVSSASTRKEIGEVVTYK